MNKVLHLLVISCVLMMSVPSCKERADHLNHHIIDFSRVKPQNIDKLGGRRFNIVSYGQIDTADGSLLKSCSFEGIMDSVFIVKDGSKVLVVGLDGHVNRRIEHVGRGPNEYLEIYSTAIDKEGGRVFILGDYSNNKRVSVYSFSGEHLETLLLSEAGSSICYYENSLYYTTLPESESPVRRIDLDKKADTAIISPFNFRNRAKTAIINLDYINYEDGCVLYHKALCDTLFKVSDDSMYPYLIFELGGNGMPVEYQSTLELLHSKQDEYINIQNTTICDGMLYMWFWYRHVLYFDIWDINGEELVYRKYYKENELKDMDENRIGLPISVNDHEIYFWPKKAADGMLFSDLSQDDARRIIPDYKPELNQPFIMARLESLPSRETLPSSNVSLTN